MSEGGLFHTELTERFLQALDPEASGFTFQTFGDRTKSPSLARVYNGPFNQLASELTAMNLSGAGVYVTISRTDLAGRKKKNVTEPRAVFCDFDDMEPPSGTGALPPSVVVQSKNGKHVYWLLKLDAHNDLSQWSLVQEAIARKLGADPACKDPPRVMRLPGLRHLKGEPFNVSLLECHPERRYEIDEIVRAYNLTLTPKQAPKTRPAHEGGETLVDDFNARGDWSFLPRHGWTHVRDYGDEGRWSRPGKIPIGISATTDHDGHVGIFFVFSSDAHPFESNQGYSRFQAYSLLEHNGDHSAAAKALGASGFGTDPKTWATEQARQRDEQLLEGTLRDGPPPDLSPPHLTIVPDEAPGDPDGWVPTDEDIPPEYQTPTASGGKSKKDSGGKKPPPRSIHTGGGCGGDPQDGTLDFRVSAVRILDSDPPSWQLEIDGSKILRLTTAELDSPRTFRRRFLEVLHRRPSVPTGKGSDEIWSDILNSWLAQAEIIDQPEDSSDLGSVRSVLRNTLRELTRGESLQDLLRGKSLAHPTEDGVHIVLGTALQVLLREIFGERVAPRMMGEALRDLKCTPDRARIEKRRMRVWCFSPQLDEPDWVEDGENPQKELSLE
jgi:hypothetical protein